MIDSKVIGPKVTLAALAAKKKLPEKFLADIGVSDDPRGILITYRLEDGTLSPRQRLRIGISAKDGFRWV